MTRPADLIGKTFGRLKVIRRHSQNNHRMQAMWECVCSCNNENIVIVPTTSLRKEITRSCGCLRKENSTKLWQKHGLSEKPEYGVWAGIKQRCYNEKEPSYPDYGGRGIAMSDDWKESFEAFYQDMGPRPTPNHTIERNNNNLDYASGNCSWITRKEQASNRRSNIYYELGGEVKTLMQWCEELELKYHTVYARLKRGMSFEEALQFIEYSTITFEGDTKSLIDWCHLLGLEYAKVYLRMLRGETFHAIASE